MAILVEHLELGISSLNGAAAQAGGYVLETKTDLSQEYYKQADVKIAVPVDQFEATLERIRKAAKKVESEQASGVDASQEYVDLQSEIANLEATAARIREFLNQAKTVEEALAVNAKLTEIEGQIGQRKGRLNYIAQRAAYSTIAVHLQETPPEFTPTPTATPTPLPAWRPGDTVYEATSALTTLLQVLGNMAIWLVIVWLPLIVIAVAVWWVARWVWVKLKLRGLPRGGPRPPGE